MKKKLLATLTALALIFSLGAANAFAATADEVAADVQATASYIAGMYDESNPVTYANYKDVIFVLRSGIAADDLVDTYLASVKDTLDSTGMLAYNGVESPAYYAGAAIVLALTGQDGTNFEGYNLIEKIEKSDRSAMTSGNVYLLADILYAVQSYRYDVTDDTLETDLVNAIKDRYLDGDAGTGIDNWGVSTDNNGTVIPVLLPYCDNDPEINEIVTKSVAWTKTQQNPDTGLFQYTDQDPYSVFNANSTGLALNLLAATGDDAAAAAYNGLSVFQSPTVPGAYGYSDTNANYSATANVLWGLLSYQRSLNSQTPVFDISDTPVAQYPSVIASINALPETVTLADADVIAAVRASFDALPEAFQKKIDSSRLVAAEQALAALQGSSSTSSSSPDSSVSQTESSDAEDLDTAPTGNAGPVALLFTCVLSAGAVVLLKRKHA